MTRPPRIGHEFVDYIPDDLKDGTVYVSIRFATAVHRCCCGCGSEVVTPFSPTDWTLTYDGQTISLDPSIGNWNFPCQSHYWIRNNQVLWARRWSRREIESGRAIDRLAKQQQYHGDAVDRNETAVGQKTHADESTTKKEHLWRRIRKLWQ